jgi:glycosyltransferase involved in cell wall biosynthesis
MHVLFVHQNYPAQFGHLAAYLVRHHGDQCTFLSQKAPGEADGIRRIQYQLRGGATERSHYCSRTFENAIWHTHAVAEALATQPDLRPDVIVGHSGFGSTLFLRELFACPILNYFEYFYRTTNSDMDFRKDFPPPALIDRMRARARNATLLLDLDNCDLGYSPTRWQRDRLPPRYHDKVRVAFDGIDTSLWHARPGQPRRLGNFVVPDGMKVVTYVSRGFESIRGFDVFMRMAKLLCDRRRDVLFLVVGQDRVCYGGDQKLTGDLTFKQWVLSRGDYDLSRFVFTDLIPMPRLAELFSFTDLHVYLTVPFVLSWSLFNALGCGATVLGSDTGPVRELIEPGRTGLLADFFDVEGLAAAADKVLDDPLAYKPLGAAAAELVRTRYSLDVCAARIRQIIDATREIYDARRGFASEYPADAQPPAGVPAPPAGAARQHASLPNGGRPTVPQTGAPGDGP